jgi:hypothetical protein
LHVVSLSKTSVVYKVRGDAEALRRYFPELSRPEFKSAITLGPGVIRPTLTLPPRRRRCSRRLATTARSIRLTA